ncbi:MAG: hypothetical protein K2F79_07525 [Muribaculaceae bacterium]|nr:hypothetical protein [Muribaculaceae bacterium]
MTRFLKLTIVSLAALLCCGTAAAVDATAASLLQGLRKKMGAPTVEVFFTINGGDGPVQGSALMSGTKIAMTTPLMCVWYDGTTQWTYLTKNRELNISQPDASELLVTNPFAILSADASAYKARRLSDAYGMRRVELVPTDDASGIASIIVSINPEDSWPSAIKVTFTDNRSIGLAVDRIRKTDASPISAFRYNKAAYPADEIIDLR